MRPETVPFPSAFNARGDRVRFSLRPAHQPPQDPAEKSTRAAWAEAESNLFDAAESGTSGLWKPFKQRQKEYLEASRVNTALARETAKRAKQEARWAAQEERDTKLKGWLESRSEDQINAFLSSEQFDKLPNTLRSLSIRSSTSSVTKQRRRLMSISRRSTKPKPRRSFRFPRRRSRCPGRSAPSRPTTKTKTSTTRTTKKTTALPSRIGDEK